MTRSLRILWVLCSFAVLAAAFVLLAQGAERDVAVLVIYGMLLLAFPASLLVAALFTGLILLQEQSGVPLLELMESSYVGLSTMWAVYFAAGYVQWFVLLPKILGKWKPRVLPHPPTGA